MPRRTCWLSCLALCVVLGVASPLDAQAPPPSTLQWLSGCWELREADYLIEEQWMQARGDGLLGMSRTTQGDHLAGFEFMRIFSRGDSLVFAAQPSGHLPTEFVAARRESGFVIFENLDHDFPQRIQYRAAGADSLIARIEGWPDGHFHAVDFPFGRVACPRP